MCLLLLTRLHLWSCFHAFVQPAAFGNYSRTGSQAAGSAQDLGLGLDPILVLSQALRTEMAG